MTRKRWGVLFVVGAVGIAAPLFGEGGGKKQVTVTNTQQVPFQPGGTIHLNHSYGYLSVEGWDRPEVELTVSVTGVVLLVLVTATGFEAGTHNCTIATVLSNPGAVESQMPMKL